MKKFGKYVIYLIALILLALFVTGKISSESFKEGNLTFSKAWQGQFIAINGEKVRYIQQGEGKDILLIHGTPGSIEDWQPLIDTLSKKYRVTAFDRLGHGFSTARNYHYTIQENVALVNHLIEKLALDSVLVVGHSYGGSIAACMATNPNPAVRSYILIASPLYYMKPEMLFTLNTIPFIGKGITTLLSKTVASQKIEEGLLDAYGGNSEIIGDDFLSIRKQLWSQPKVLQATSRERTNFNKDVKKITSQYKNINKKVSIFYGTNDHLLIQQDGKKISQNIPNATLLVQKNAAHYIQFERENEVLQAIHNHMNTIVTEVREKENIVLNNEQFFFKRDNIKLPVPNKIYTSSSNEVVLFRPTEFEFGKMVEDNQSSKLVSLDEKFEALTNTLVAKYSNNRQLKITISEKPYIAVENTKDTLYLNASKLLYGIVINRQESKPRYISPHYSIDELTKQINTIFNLKK